MKAPTKRVLVYSPFLCSPNFTNRSFSPLSLVLTGQLICKFILETTPHTTTIFGIQLWHQVDVNN